MLCTHVPPLATETLSSVKMRLLSVLTPPGMTELSVRLRAGGERGLGGGGGLADNYNSRLKHNVVLTIAHLLWSHTHVSFRVYQALPTFIKV